MEILWMKVRLSNIVVHINYINSDYLSLLAVFSDISYQLDAV